MERGMSPDLTMLTSIKNDSISYTDAIMVLINICQEGRILMLCCSYACALC